jgi:hypothetical protein
MSLAEKMKAKAAKLRDGSTSEKVTPISKKKESGKTKKAAPKGEEKTRQTKVDIPWQKVVTMYNAGKSSSEISDALGFTNEKSNWPYSYTLGLLKRLRQGVNVNGKVLKIAKRGKAA